MNQMKRSSDHRIDENNNIKKFKSIVSRSHFEHLANETIYQIFEYLDIYEIYYSFFSSNNRFQNLILNSNFPIQIHVPNISKRDFELYSSHMIQPNRHRINYLHLTNPFTFNQLFSLPSLIYEFQQLEILILENIDIKYFSNSFRFLAKLPHFHTINISFANTIDRVKDLYEHIFHLPYLKSCSLTYRTKHDVQPKPIHLDQYEKSSIEHLTINARLRFDSISDLLTCLPNLCYLSIDCLIASNFSVLIPSVIVLNQLKYVSIKFEDLSFVQLNQLANNYFEFVEHFYITIRSQHYFLNLHQWTDFFREYMINLKTFDLNYINIVRGSAPFLHLLFICHGNSFSYEKKWFFSHQHFNCGQEDHSIMLYSMNPYRRNDFIIYGKRCDKNSDESISHYESVKSLQIDSKKPAYCQYYFPNVIELKLEKYFTQSTNKLDRILSLKKLETLEIADWNFPLDEIIQLLYYSPELHTLKLHCLSLFRTNIQEFEQHPYFQSFIRTNQIKSFHLSQMCTLDMFNFLSKTFPRIEYMKIQICTREIYDILQYLFSKTQQRPFNRLKFLCFTQTPQRCLKELDNFIQSNKLVENYSIKLLNRQLYLWW